MNGTLFKCEMGVMVTPLFPKLCVLLECGVSKSKSSSSSISMLSFDELFSIAPPPAPVGDWSKVFLSFIFPNILTLSKPLGKAGLRLVEGAGEALEIVAGKALETIAGEALETIGDEEVLETVGEALETIGEAICFCSWTCGKLGNISTTSSTVRIISWPLVAFKGSLRNEKLCRVKVWELDTEKRKT